MRRWLLSFILRSGGLLVLVALAFVGVDVIGGFKLVVEARPSYLIPAFLVICAAVLVRMVVWLALARSLGLGYHRLRSYVKIFLVGWSSGLALPRGASPVARAVALAADRRSVGRGVVVDIADRLLQVITFLVLLAISGVYLSVDSHDVLKGVGLALAVLAGATVVVALVFRLTQRWFFRFLSHRRWTTFVEDVKVAIGELRRMPSSLLLKILALTFMASMLTTTSLFLASRSLDIGLSYPALLAAFAAVSLTVVLPISINGLGPREGILTAAVAGAGFSSEAGVALGLLWFAMQAVTRIAALAGWFMNSKDGV